MGSPRIVVVHGRPVRRRALASALEAAGLEVVGVAGDVGAALVEIERTSPALVLLDGGIEDGGTAEAVRTLVGAEQAPPVVVLADPADPGDMLAAVRAGAAGYLAACEPARLAAALRGVLRGEAGLSRRMAGHLVEDVRRSGGRAALARARSDVRLTPRQLQILRLIARGRTTGEIASELYLSPETVRWHVKAILRKLRARTRAEAAAALAELSA